MSARQYAQTNQTSAPIIDFSSRGAFNIVEAAAYCGVRCAAVEEAIRDGRLCGRRFGRNVIILKNDLDAFLTALEIIPAHIPPSVLKRRQERSQSVAS